MAKNGLAKIGLAKVGHYQFCVWKPRKNSRSAIRSRLPKGEIVGKPVRIIPHPGTALAKLTSSSLVKAMCVEASCQAVQCGKRDCKEFLLSIMWFDVRVAFLDLEMFKHTKITFEVNCFPRDRSFSPFDMIDTAEVVFARADFATSTRHVNKFRKMVIAATTRKHTSFWPIYNFFFHPLLPVKF